MTRILVSRLVAVALLISANAFAQGTAFTYQGRLADGGSAATGVFDFRFQLYGAASGGSSLGTVTWDDAVVSNGIFTVTLDFGAGAFPGSERWLGIGVRYGTNTGAYTVLEPRQPITPTPYAMFAANAGTVTNGAITSAQLANNAVNSAVIANGSIAEADLTPTLANDTFWRLGGNAGTTPGADFIGTSDNQPLELRVNGERGLLLQRPTLGATMVIGGQGNTAAANVSGATIGGGYSNILASSSFESTIAGGVFNLVNSGAAQAAIGGGGLNTIGANARYATVAGGGTNMASRPGAFVGGGMENLASGTNSVVVGGWANQATYTGAAIAGGIGNSATWIEAFVGGGGGNRAEGANSTVAGGLQNVAEGYISTISGGQVNRSAGQSSTVAGGAGNSSGGGFSAVPGGAGNSAAGEYSFAAGRRAKANHNGSFVWGDDHNADFPSTTNKQFAVRANNGVMIQATNTALDLRGGGALRVQGAGVGSATPVFIHRATAANTGGNLTQIDHPHCNGDPNAILIVTHNYSADTAANQYETVPFGVWYDGSRWTIYHETGAVMPVGRAFNVIVFKP